MRISVDLLLQLGKEDKKTDFITTLHTAIHLQDQGGFPEGHCNDRESSCRRLKGPSIKKTTPKGRPSSKDINVSIP